MLKWILTGYLDKSIAIGLLDRNKLLYGVGLGRFGPAATTVRKKIGLTNMYE